ncbi:MAG: hypothetical protein MK212_16180, partial [Saprospiraceae bacterium]|nr:hypothetical protein [Saprospiraceae bacterium]
YTSEYSGILTIIKQLLKKQQTGAYSFISINSKIKTSLYKTSNLWKSRGYLTYPIIKKKNMVD